MKKSHAVFLGGAVIVVILLAVFAGGGTLKNLWQNLVASPANINSNSSQNAFLKPQRLVDSTGAEFGDPIPASELPTIGAGGSRVVVDDPQEDDAAANGVIIKFTAPSAFSVVGDSLKKGKGRVQADKDAQVQRSALKNEHSKAIIAINKELSKKYNKQLDFKAHKKDKGIARATEYTDALNGFAVMDIPVDEAISTFSTLPGVESVTPNYMMHATLTESVPQINADQVWQYTSQNGVTLDGSGIKVGVIDTGIDYTHPSLGGCFGSTCKVRGGWDFINNDADPFDDQGHGTHVASTVAGNDTFIPTGKTTPVSIRGVAPGATLYGYKVLNAFGSGPTSTVILGIQRCADPNGDGKTDDHLDVCTMSLGGLGGSPDSPDALAVDAAVAAGSVFTIAAGNAGPGSQTVATPGTSRKAITVAAACKNGNTSGTCANGPIANFSSRGPVVWSGGTLQKPDISAPGVSICAALTVTGTSSSWPVCGTSTTSGAKYAAISGTSMATPHVAGVVALIREAHPELTPDQIKSILVGSAVPYSGVDATVQGFRGDLDKPSGLIDSYGALLNAGIPSSSISITNLPIIFDDPVATEQATFSQTITITNKSGKQITFNPTYSGMTGVTAAFSPATVVLEGSGASSVLNLTVTLSIDHTIVSSPKWVSGVVTLTPTNGDKPVTVGAVISARNRLLSSGTSFNLGDNNAGNPSWSSQKSITLSNSMLDIPENKNATPAKYTVSVSSFPAGVTVTANQQSFTLNPGGSTTLTLSASIPDNTKVGNGFYSGTVTVTSPLETRTFSIGFSKGYVVNLNYVNGSPTVVQVVNKNYDTCLPASISNTQQLFFLKNPGPYIIHAQYAPFVFCITRGGMSVVNASTTGYTNPSGEIARYVIKRNIPVGGTASFDPLTANKKITFKPTLPDGSQTGYRYFYISIIDRANGTSHGPTYPLYIDSNKNQYGAYVSFNEMGPDTKLEAWGEASDSAKNWIATFLYQVEDVLTGDIMFSNTVNDFLKKNIYTPNIPGLKVFSGSCSNLNTYSPCSFSDYNTVLASYPYPVSWYSYSVGGSTPDASQYADYPAFAIGYGIGADANFNPLYQTFQFYPTAQKLYAWHKSLYGDMGPSSSEFYNHYKMDIPSETNISLGSSPLLDTSMWSNYINSGGFGLNILQSSKGQDTGSYFTFGGLGREYTDVFPTYIMKINNVVESSGDIKTKRFGLPAVGSSAAEQNVKSGNYEVTLSRNTTVNGVAVSSKSVTKFKIQATPIIDENPPYVENAYIMANGIQQGVIDPNASSTISFVVNPNPGMSSMAMNSMPDSLGVVSLGINTDGGSVFAPISLTKNGNVFTAVVPVTQGATVYTFKIDATDAIGNSLSNQFQIPAGVAINPTEFKTPKIISPITVSFASPQPTFTWTTDSPADSVVSFGTSPGVYFTKQPDPKLTTSHTIYLSVNLQAGTRYYYKASSSNAIGGDSSIEQSFTYENTAPTISAVATSLISNAGATVTFTTNEPADTQISYGTVSGSYPNSTVLDKNLVTAHSAALTGLSPSTKYYYIVRTKDFFANTKTSAQYSFTTATAPETAVPTITSNPVVSAIKTNSATFTWDTDVLSDTQLFFSTVDGGPYTQVKNTTPTTHHVITVATFSPNTKYYFLAKSANTLGTATASSSFSTLAVADTTAPSVTAFSIPGTSGSLIVPITTFTASDNVGVTGYMLTESSTKPSATASGWSISVPTSYTFATTGSKVLYAWAKDAAGYVSTSKSASVTITIAANQPPSITNLSSQTVYLPSHSVSVTPTITDDNYNGSKVTATWTPAANTTFSPTTGTNTAPLTLPTTITVPQVAGTYSVTLTATDGTLSATQTITITVATQGSSTTYTDDFSAATLNSIWNKLSGAWTVSSGKLWNAPSATVQLLTTPTITGATQSGTVTITPTSTQNTKMGIVLRQSAGNYYICSKVYGGSSQYRIEKVTNNGAPVSLASLSSNNTLGSYTLSCSIAGSTITMTTPLGTKTYTDPTPFTTGTPGLYYSGPAVAQSYDDVTVSGQ